MKVIGIAGKMGCGKTILAEALEEYFPKTKVLNFGDILKKEVADKYGFPLELCYSHEGKNAEVVVTDDAGMCSYKTVRELLQWYGTDFIRAKDPDYWIKRMQELLELEQIHGTKTIIIGDMRFPNEVDFILKWHGHAIRLRPYAGYLYPHGDATHESETALDDRNDFWLDIAPPFGTLNRTAHYVAALILG